MTQDKLAYYPWYPRDFNADGPVATMTLEEEACYRRLLDHQWLNGSIPSDVRLLARICKNIPLPRMRRLWGVLAPLFPQNGDGGLKNRRLERVRADAIADIQSKSEAGKKGAEGRWGRHSGRNATALRGECPAEADAETNTDLNNSSSSGDVPANAIAYRQKCTIACNRGLRENPAIGASFNELVTSSQTEPDEWMRLGIPVEMAEQVIFERAKLYRPAGRNRQPTNLRYFTKPVREAFEISQGRLQERRSPRRTATTPTPRRAATPLPRL